MLVLLDFDGVVNAISKNPPKNIHPRETWHSTTCYEQKAYPIMYSETVVNFFNELSREHDVVWLTTWREHTEQFRSKLGFSDFPFADEITHRPDPLEWWKYGVAKKLIEDKPFVWIDDEFKHGRVKEQQELKLHKKPYMLVGPAVTHGLTPKELKNIKEFCEDFDNA